MGEDESGEAVREVVALRDGTTVSIVTGRAVPDAAARARRGGSGLTAALRDMAVGEWAVRTNQPRPAAGEKDGPLRQTRMLVYYLERTTPGREFYVRRAGASIEVCRLA